MEISDLDTVENLIEGLFRMISSCLVRRRSWSFPGLRGGPAAD